MRVLDHVHHLSLHPPLALGVHGFPGPAAAATDVDVVGRSKRRERRRERPGAAQQGAGGGGVHICCLP